MRATRPLRTTIFAGVKKVLIITYYWPPSGGIPVQRILKFTKYLRDFGWEPVVYTVLNGEFPVVDADLEKEVPEGIVVLKRPIWEPYSFYKFFSGKNKKSHIDRATIKAPSNASWKEKISIWIRGNFFIPDTRRFWIKPSIKFLVRYLKENPVQAIISTGPPHSNHMIAQGVSKLLHVPWLADFRDPWTTMDYYKDMMLTRLADRKHRKLELMVLKQADAVCVVGNGVKKEFEEKGAKNVHLISNGYDTSDFDVAEPVALDEAFTIVHTGSFLVRRNPEALWKAIQSLLKEEHPLLNHLQIKLIGRVDGAIVESMNSYNLQRLYKLVAYVPHDEAVRRMQSAQVLLLPIDNFDGAKWVITGKLYEYMVARRPILCIGPTDGDAAAIIRETLTGEVFDFDDANGIKAHIVDLYNDYLNHKNNTKSKGIEKFSRRELTRELAQVLNSISQ